jgi:hypothetical protein
MHTSAAWSSSAQDFGQKVDLTVSQRGGRKRDDTVTNGSNG